MRGLSLVAASGGHSSSGRAGLSLSWPLLLRSTGSRHAGSVVVAHGPSCSAACGIFPDQGSNPCALHWQADSQPLRHRGSPIYSQTLIFHYVNKSQYSLSISLWMAYKLLIFFTNTENNGRIFLCMPPVYMGETFSHVYTSKSWNRHTLDVLKYC